MNTMASVLLERETVEGEIVQALLDDTWDEYLAQHPEEGHATDTPASNDAQEGTTSTASAVPAVDENEQASDGPAHLATPSDDVS
jgi:cell division protease FtsH